MVLNFAGPLVSSNLAIYPMVASNAFINPKLECCGRLNITQKQQSGRSSCRFSRSRRRTRPNSALLGPRCLHPCGNLPEGVPSSLFKLKPRATPKKYTPRQAPSGRRGGPGEDAATAGAATAPAAVVVEATEALYVRLAEERDLAEISALLAQVFEPGIVIDAAELRSDSSLERLQQANEYLQDMAYKQIFRSFKSRCGSRLRRGDFALSSDALVLAVRDDRRNAGTGATPVAQENGPEDGAGVDVDGGGGDVGRIVAVVELSLRQPEGWLPLTGFFNPPLLWEPYMCNLAVAEEYRGNGYGKQLVRLCESVASNHWGYERIYLHFDADNAAATNLYSSMGYKAKEQFQAPSWFRQLLRLRNIQYQVKHLNEKKEQPFGDDGD